MDDGRSPTLGRAKCTGRSVSRSRPVCQPSFPTRSWKTPGLLEDHEAVELAAADVHEAVVLDERERPVRVRRMSFLKITSS